MASHLFGSREQCRNSQKTQTQRLMSGLQKKQQPTRCPYYAHMFCFCLVQFCAKQKPEFCLIVDTLAFCQLLANHIHSDGSMVLLGAGAFSTSCLEMRVCMVGQLLGSEAREMEPYVPIVFKSMLRENVQSQAHPDFHNQLPRSKG